MSKKMTTKSKPKNQRYPQEYKEEAMKLADRIGAAQAATELGIYASQIYGWRKTKSNSMTQNERESAQSTEIARLKRQLADATEELEILKKAATYFAKNQK